MPSENILTENIEEKIQVREAEISVREKKPKTDLQTRSELAVRFMHYYFWILILIIIGVPSYNFLMYTLTNQPGLIISVKDAILTYSAVVGSTFGLVVAYYFKDKEEEKNKDTLL